eukprot:1181741-Prorocentrum_minimum.AAC.1
MIVSHPCGSLWERGVMIVSHPCGSADCVTPMWVSLGARRDDHVTPVWVSLGAWRADCVTPVWVSLGARRDDYVTPGPGVRQPPQPQQRALAAHVAVVVARNIAAAAHHEPRERRRYPHARAHKARFEGARGGHLRECGQHPRPLRHPRALLRARLPLVQHREGRPRGAKWPRRARARQLQPPHLNATNPEGSPGGHQGVNRGPVRG